MARISDTIEIFIKEMLQSKDDNKILIQRNELADRFCCAPSQINYVLTTRFTYEKGYVIESKRGGGGCIVITKIEYNDNSEKMDIINQAIGDSITYQGTISLINHLYESKIISYRELEIIKVSINDRTLAAAEDKNKIRAEMLKGIIAIVLA